MKDHGLVKNRDIYRKALLTERHLPVRKLADRSNRGSAFFLTLQFREVAK